MAMEDKIGRQEFVDKICGLVDSLKKDHHTCIAINGDWGSGKSFVLNMMEESLELIQNEETKLINSSKDSNLTEMLTSSYTSLENLHDRFSDFSEAK